MFSLYNEIKNKRTFIIAEVGQAHEGSLGLAHSFIDAVSETGVNAIKFQTHIAEYESSHLDQFRVKNKFLQDKDRYSYWKRMEFTFSQWQELKKHCDEKGLIFISSPFSIEAAELLNKLDIFLWKIASGEVSNLPMIEYICKTKKPILLSSGLSSFDQLDETVNYIKSFNNELAIMQCTSAYPCPPEKIGLNNIQDYKNRYSNIVGLSDHSGSIIPSLTAVTLGAEILELHVTFSKQMFGFDTKASLTISDFKFLVSGVRMIEEMLSNPVDKSKITNEQAELKKLFEKSVYLKNDVFKNDTSKDSDFTFKKPNLGIPARKFKNLIGLKYNKDIKNGKLLKESDFYDKT